MSDELKHRLRSIDPVSSDETIEPVTSATARRRLEDIMSTPPIEQPTRDPERSRTPWYAAAAAVAVAVVAIAGIITLGSTEDAPTASEPLELVAGPFDAMMSCIVPSAEVLAPVEVAFAGTVSTIDGETITLTVDRWYTGGDAEIVVVRAPAGFEALTGSVPWAEGEAFLVSATGGTVNYCGLSGPATPELQAIYDGAFGG